MEWGKGRNWAEQKEREERQTSRYKIAKIKN
jgi:hypothetical protein